MLSGTGRDGSQGVRAIRAAGGRTIAQDPATAQFADLPRAAIATGCIDLEVAAEDVGQALSRRRKPISADDPRGADSEHTDRVAAPSADTVTDILALVRDHTGIDFAGYKSGTVRRQIARRCEVLGVEGTADYLEIMGAHESEASTLTDALLVTVTSFFRDGAVWDRLEELLRERWGALDADQTLRLWVPGCATGEEAFTVAMVAAEALGRPDDFAARVKIFATDLSEESLQVARAGHYSDTAVRPIPRHLRSRWWRARSTGWEVSPALRAAVVFARHNLAVDPPFLRTDLITLRNTLIYFQESLQRRVLSLCRYSLVGDGLLVLGTSELVSGDAPGFNVVDDVNRIYVRTADAYPIPVTAASPVRVARTERKGPRLRDTLVARLVPAALVVDGADDVVDVIGDVTPWCWVAQGPPSLQVLALLREDLRPTVQTLLLRLRHGGGDEVEARLQTPDGQLHVRALVLGEPFPAAAIITFEVEDLGTVDAGPAPADSTETVMELATTRAALQSVVEEVTASNEELQALNEELQASTEEAQSANEELQSSHEELSTLYEESQARGAELVQVNRDLQNIQTSVSAGLIMVDADLRVTRFNPAAVRVFALIDTDIGRELQSVPTTVAVPDLARNLRAAAHAGRPSMTSIAGQDGDFLLQVRPYLSEGQRPAGAMVVLTDISELAATQRRVAEALHQFAAVTDVLPEAVWQRDRAGEIVLASRGVETIFGLDRGRVMADPGLLRDAVHPEDRARVAVASSAKIDVGPLRYRVVRPDGSTRWVEEAVQEVEADGPHAAFSVGCVRDVTELVEMERVAAQRNETLEAIFDIGYLGVLLLDADARITRANQAFATFSGYDSEALIGMPIQALTTMFGEAGVAGAGPAQPWPVGGGTQTLQLVTKDGAPHWVAVEVKELRDDFGAGDQTRARTLVTLHDITPMIDATDRLARQVRFDHQTGALSRAHFRDRIADEISRATREERSFGLIWIDLDGFKAINDTFGHGAGDLVLAEVVSRLQGVTRSHDPVGRLGGDEFGLIVTQLADIHALDVTVDKILGVLRQPIMHPQGTLFVTGSVGAAVGPQDGRTADELLHNADTAMYVAKSHGGDGRAYFRTSMDEVAQQRGELRQEIAAAIRARDFLVHYQPVIDLHTGGISMVEALVRWRRGDRTASAAEFIDDVQQSGQIKAISSIARDCVEADLAALDVAAGAPPWAISVNVAVDELEDPELATRFLAWEPPGGMSRIIVEITEHTLLEGSGRAMTTLNLLHRLGARLCIDDFGTGYSNLSVLRTLKPSIIKIDKSLLTGAPGDDVATGLLAAAIHMGHALGAQVVVEGVEREDEAELLRNLGADAGQGYLFARPMAVADLPAWSAEHATSRAAGRGRA